MFCYAVAELLDRAMVGYANDRKQTAQKALVEHGVLFLQDCAGINCTYLVRKICACTSSISCACEAMNASVMFSSQSKAWMVRCNQTLALHPDVMLECVQEERHRVPGIRLEALKTMAAERLCKV